ncbi:MAG: CpaF family protein, partial [Sphingomonadales bacterium]
MSAFGKKGNAGGMKPGARPAFGVARPMKGAGAAPRGGEQFPPIPGEAPAPRPAPAPSANPARPATTSEAIDRLNERMAAVNEANSEVGGFEASIHKIKEQVLPR